jgi:tetratricopeptide (TPR) repeat protein
MNRPQEAKAAFNGLLELGTNGGDAHYGTAMALAMEGKHQDAINEFKAAIKDGSDMSGLYSEMAKSYAALRMYDDAITAYMKEKELNGDTPEIEGGLADAYQAKGMQKEAQQARAAAEQLKAKQPQQH